MIKDVKERQMALEIRLPNASKFYFYEACLITMKAVIRLAHRYAELAREMAAKEKNEARKAELIAPGRWYENGEARRERQKDPELKEVVEQLARGEVRKPAISVWSRRKIPAESVVDWDTSVNRATRCYVFLLVEAAQATVRSV